MISFKKALIMPLLFPMCSIAQHDPGYESHTFKHTWTHSWGKAALSNKRTQFSCSSYGAQGDLILVGTEISFRDIDARSSEGACWYWANITDALFNGDGIKDVNNYGSGVIRLMSAKTSRLINKDVPLSETYIFISNNSVAGFYSTSDKPSRLFSEGSFVTPVKAMPRSGYYYYSGILTHDGGRVKDNDLLRVDFSNNKIYLKLLNFKDSGGDSVVYESKNPISFDPDSGFFKGEISSTTFYPHLPSPYDVSINKVVISGSIGGENGELISASMHDGTPLSDGFYFLLAKAVK